jgi:hypothetical protein
MAGDKEHPPIINLGLVKEPEVDLKPTPTKPASEGPCPPPTPCSDPAPVC